eukprot:1195993-Prorocentrum_minimum.AAC.4
MSVLSPSPGGACGQAEAVVRIPVSQGAHRVDAIRRGGHVGRHTGACCLAKACGAFRGREALCGDQGTTDQAIVACHIPCHFKVCCHTAQQPVAGLEVVPNVEAPPPPLTRRRRAPCCVTTSGWLLVLAGSLAAARSATSAAAALPSDPVPRVTSGSMTPPGSRLWQTEKPD